MNYQFKKIRLIFIPFLFIAVGFILLYTFLNWLLVMKLGLIHFNENAINIYLPLILSLIPISIWLRPRVRLIQFPQKSAAFLSILFYLLMIITMAVPTIIAQRCLLFAANELIHLSTIDEISNKPGSRFFTVSNYYIDKRRMGIYHSISTFTVKKVEHFHCNIYISCPVYSGTTVLSQFPHAWIGVSYQTRIDNQQDQETKMRLWNDFYQDSVNAFKSGNISFQYLDKIGVTPERTGFIKAAQKSGYTDPAQPIIVLVPVNTQYEGLNSKYLVWIFSVFGPGMVILLMLILKFQLRGITIFRMKKEIRRSQDSVLNYLVPGSGCFITLLVICVNIAIFILTAISGLGIFSYNGEELLNWGANYRPLTLDGQWWRLFTCMFLHAAFSIYLLTCTPCFI